MKRTAGIKPFSKFDETLLGELKQSVLLFDLIGIPTLDSQIENFNQIHAPNSKHRYFIDELEYLREQGYLFDSLKGISFDSLKINTTTIRDDVHLQALANEINELLLLLEKKETDTESAMETGARISSLLLNDELKVQDFFSIPLLKRSTLTDNNKLTKTNVINLIVEQMPIPDDQTPWENIFEFKSNSDNKGRFSGMRTWVNKTINSGLSEPEIRDELEYLLYQYKKSLELHKIKHHSGVLQTIIVGTSEIIENVIKLKFSNVAKGLFSAHQSKADLLNAELTAPGNELSYIYKAREAFSN